MGGDRDARLRGEKEGGVGSTGIGECRGDAMYVRGWIGRGVHFHRETYIMQVREF